MIFPFGEYLPDQADLTKGSQMANNCAPDESGYVSLDSLTTYSNALDAKCQGFYSVKDTQGNAFNFAGNATKLYKLSSATFSDISKSGGYSISSADRWEFTTYGNLVIATNDSNISQLSTTTQTVIITLDQMIRLAETYVTGDTLDAGITKEVFGSYEYLSKRVLSIKLTVLTRESFLAI